MVHVGMTLLGCTEQHLLRKQQFAERVGPWLGECSDLCSREHAVAIVTAYELPIESLREIEWAVETTIMAMNIGSLVTDVLKFIAILLVTQHDIKDAPLNLSDSGPLGRTQVLRALAIMVDHHFPDHDALWNLGDGAWLEEPQAKARPKHHAAVTEDAVRQKISAVLWAKLPNYPDDRGPQPPASERSQVSAAEPGSGLRAVTTLGSPRLPTARWSGMLGDTVAEGGAKDRTSID